VEKVTDFQKKVPVFSCPARDTTWTPTLRILRNPRNCRYPSNLGAPQLVFNHGGGKGESTTTAGRYRSGDRRHQQKRGEQAALLLSLPGMLQHGGEREVSDE